MGFKSVNTPKNEASRVIGYVREPYVTDSQYGDNAFGSVLAELENGARIGLSCEHGGSAWLCLSCAKSVVAND